MNVKMLEHENFWDLAAETMVERTVVVKNMGGGFKLIVEIANISDEEVEMLKRDLRFRDPRGNFPNSLEKKVTTLVAVTDIVKTLERNGYTNLHCIGFTDKQMRELERRLEESAEEREEKDWVL